MAFTGAILASAVPALAPVVDAARAEGRVEEGRRGFLGVRDELWDVDSDELATLDEDAAVHHDGIDRLRPGREDERRERVAAGAGVGEPPRVDEHEVGGLAGLEAAEV